MRAAFNFWKASASPEVVQQSHAAVCPDFVTTDIFLDTLMEVEPGSRPCGFSPKTRQAVSIHADMPEEVPDMPA